MRDAQKGVPRGCLVWVGGTRAATRGPGRRPRVHGYSTGVDITFNGFTLRIYTTPVNKAYW